MRSVKKRLALYIVLIFGIAMIAIPVAARVCVTARAVANEQQEYLDRQARGGVATTASKDSKDKKAARYNKDSKTNKDVAIVPGVVRRQDDYYERRRQHWEKCLDNRLDDEEIGNDNDDDFADEDIDGQQDVYERRREYYRDRLDEDW